MQIIDEIVFVIKIVFFTVVKSSFAFVLSSPIAETPDVTSPATDPH